MKPRPCELCGIEVNNKTKGRTVEVSWNDKIGKFKTSARGNQVSKMQKTLNKYFNKRSNVQVKAWCCNECHRLWWKKEKKRLNKIKFEEMKEKIVDEL